MRYHVIPLTSEYTGTGWYNTFVKLRYEYRERADAIEVAENCNRLTNERWVVVDSKTWAIIYTSKYEVKRLRRKKRNAVID